MSSMRKLLLLILRTLTMPILAEEHLTFLGIPIDGQLDPFCQALEKQNFRCSSMYANPVFYGFFKDQRANVIVETTPETHIVCQVLVAFQQLNTWNELDSMYNALKADLIAQYGEPVETKEVGEGPQDHTQIRQYLEDVILIRRCKFETKTGTIDLGIDNLRLHQRSRGVPYTYLIYTDKANITIAAQEGMMCKN